jgi:hypothetical protein
MCDEDVERLPTWPGVVLVIVGVVGITITVTVAMVRLLTPPQQPSTAEATE